MCTNNVYMVMKNRALIKGFFQLFFFFLIFLQKAKNQHPPILHYITLSCAPYHHFKTGKENLKKRKIFTKKIFSVVTSLAIKKIIVLYLGIKYNQKLSCKTTILLRQKSVCTTKHINDGKTNKKKIKKI